MSSPDDPQSLGIAQPLDAAEGRSANLSHLRRLTHASPLLRQITGTLAVRGTTLAISMALGVAVARALGPHGRGEYALAMSLITLASQLCNLGLHAANTYHLSKSRHLLDRLLSNSLVVSAVMGAAAGAVLVLVRALDAGAIPLPLPLIVLAALAVPASVAVLLVQNLLLALGDVRGFNLGDVIQRAGAFAATMALIVFGASRPTNFVLVGVASGVLSLGWMLLRLDWRNHRWEPHWPTFRMSWGYGWRAYTTAMASYIVLRVDILLVSAMAGLEATGLYSIAVAMVDLLYTLAVVTGSILFPKLTSTTDPALRWAIARRYALGVGAVMLAVLLASIGLGKPVITLMFGNAYASAARPFVLLLPGLLFLSVNTILMNYLASVGMPLITVISPAIAGALNIALNVVMIPRWGASGASVASTVAYAVMLTCSLLYLRSRRGVELRQRPVAAL